MEYVNFNKAMLAFGNKVVERARLELGVTRERENRRTKWAKSGNTWQAMSSQVTKARGRINATGKLSQSLKPNVFIGKDGVPTLAIKGEDYGVVINEGRSPTMRGGGGVVVKNIATWTSIKPVRVRSIQGTNGGFIKSTPAARAAQSFLIARSIHTFGFKARPFMTEAMDGTIPKFRAILADAMAKDWAKTLKKETK